MALYRLMIAAVIAASCGAENPVAPVAQMEPVRAVETEGARRSMAIPNFNNLSRVKLSENTEATGGAGPPDPPNEGSYRGALRFNVEDPLNPGRPQSPPVWTDLWLVVGDDLPPSQWGEKLKQADLNDIEVGLEELLARAGISLDDYIDPNKTFGGALAVPQGFINSYDGLP